MKITHQTFLVLLLTILVSGCATLEKKDYTAFKQHHPRSILVLPPLNTSPEIKATPSVLAQMTYPLAESGYYVFPVALVTETFKSNGMTVAADIHAVSPLKLKEIFGADAALYVTITDYGTTYMIIDSNTKVTAEAKLVDLQTGTLLWQGKATASSDEGRSSSQGGVVGILVSALVNQIVSSMSDASHAIAGRTCTRLLSAGQPNGMLYGPRSPLYRQDKL